MLRAAVRALARGHRARAMQRPSTPRAAAAWASEWTEALERSAPPAGAGAAEPAWEADEGLLPAPHSHCSARERDAWAAVLEGPRRTLASVTAAAPSAACTAAPAPFAASAAATRAVAPTTPLSPYGTSAAGDNACAQDFPQPNDIGSRSGSRSSTSSGSGGSDAGSGDGHALPPTAVYAAVELGSHCTRALLHDGTNELARLSYDTLLGSRGGTAPGGAPPASSLAPGAADRTLAALAAVAAEVQGQRRRLRQRLTQHGGGKAVVAPSAPAARPGRAGAAAAEQGGAGAGAGEVRVVARMVGTAAVRAACGGSREDLAAAAAAAVGCPLEVLSGEQEGRLAWRGLAEGLRRTPYSGCGGILGVDMGGRSTEFIHGTSPADPAPTVVSLPLGCVSLHAAALAASAAVPAPAAAGQGPPSGGPAASADPHAPGATAASSAGGAAAEPSFAAAGGLAAAMEQARQTVELQCSGQPWWPARPAVAAADNGTGGDPASARGGADPLTVVLTGGTATTLAAMRLRLTDGYDRAAVHGSVLTDDDLAALLDALAAPGGGAAARRRFVWLTAARGATLAAGTAGLLGVMRALGATRAVVSDADSLDGLMAELLEAAVAQAGAAEAEAKGGLL